jgi:hypothetical protein
VKFDWIDQSWFLKINQFLLNSADFNEKLTKIGSKNRIQWHQIFDSTLISWALVWVARSIVVIQIFTCQSLFEIRFLYRSSTAPRNVRARKKNSLPPSRVLNAATTAGPVAEDEERTPVFSERRVSFSAAPSWIVFDSIQSSQLHPTVPGAAAPRRRSPTPC